MSVKKLLVLISATLACASASANEENPDWINISENSEIEWRGKSGSGSFADLGENKKNSYMYVYQLKKKKKNTVHYGKLVVELSSCKKGYGYMYLNTLEGSFIEKIQFVRFGPTINDDLGTMACTSWDSNTGKVSFVEKEGAWELAAKSNDGANEFLIKNNTLREINFRKKKSVSAVFAFKDVKENTTTYHKYITELATCKRGYGVTYNLDFDDKVTDETDVALNGDSVLSGMISKMCEKI